MPIYEYHCFKCGHPREINLPMAERNNPQICLCGEIMTRLMSLPQPCIMVVTNKDRLVGTMNDDRKGYRFPGNGKFDKRYKQALGKSLTRDKEVIGIGFG